MTYKKINSTSCSKKSKITVAQMFSKTLTNLWLGGKQILKESLDLQIHLESPVKLTSTIKKGIQHDCYELLEEF